MCPVCQARFRGSTECSRCGADLKTIMGLAVDAWRMRKAAREALGSGDWERARGLAARAQEICGTAAGRDLELVSGWLEGQPTRVVSVQRRDTENVEEAQRSSSGGNLVR
jgi:hypothetical protein